ncbi:MAG: choice-of-anchor I family protein [Chitinophagaceae bacterium]|nr:choice-of-anchor I family protein [Chitinophagaceae bacterium]
MKLTTWVFCCGLLFAACKKTDSTPEFFVNEDPSTFKEIGSIGIGGVGAAEISAYDPLTQRLFVVNNSVTNKIDVLDIKNPSAPVLIYSISLAPYAGAVNSLDVSNGKLAAAIEALIKQDNGKVVVFNTSDYTEVKVISVGALPDMITYTKDGNYILTANEGEPSNDYTNDPSGTVSIIEVNNGYAVTTLDFSPFASQEATLKAGGLRVFGLGNNFVKDMEPEYITTSADSKTAWITLQENNAIAKINIQSKTVTQIFPLGFKNYNLDENAIDVSDLDGAVGSFAKWPVKGVYMPDAISVLEYNGIPYLFTANEGDAREYTALTEAKRVKSMVLDPTAFPGAATLKLDAQMGRLNVTTKLGDTDNDGDYDELYSFGARSFSIWNGNTGAQVFDSKNDLDKRALNGAVYDDTRSDDKSVEPEGITIGKVGYKTVAFVGMERVDAVAMYDITNPLAPVFLQMIKCGDAPEGVLFIPAKDSPTKRSLLVVSSENDGFVKIFTPDSL